MRRRVAAKKRKGFCRDFVRRGLGDGVWTALLEKLAPACLPLFAPEAEEGDDGDDADDEEECHHEEREDEFGVGLVVVHARPFLLVGRKILLVGSKMLLVVGKPSPAVGRLWLTVRGLWVTRPPARTALRWAGAGACSVCGGCVAPRPRRRGRGRLRARPSRRGEGCARPWRAGSRPSSCSRPPLAGAG